MLSTFDKTQDIRTFTGDLHSSRHGNSQGNAMKTKRQRTEIQIETHEITRIRFRKEGPSGQQAFDVENTANMADRLLPDHRDPQGTENNWLKTTEE